MYIDLLTYVCDIFEVGLVDRLLSRSAQLCMHDYLQCRHNFFKQIKQFTCLILAHLQLNPVIITSLNIRLLSTSNNYPSKTKINSQLKSFGVSYSVNDNQKFWSEGAGINRFQLYFKNQYTCVQYLS